MVSADIESHCSEEILDCISSDHLPVLTKINIIKHKQKKRRTRWNFKKADWDLFRKTAEEKIELENLDNKSIDDTNDLFTSIILEAAKKSIPRGCRANFKPFWNEQLQKATEVKNQARREYERDASNLEKKVAYNRAVAKSKLITKEAKKEAWTTKCEGLNLQNGGREA